VSSRRDLLVVLGAAALSTRFDLVVNLKTAKALGITIPRPVLLQADRLIK
jgi:ABC-type uncharacterized transport system substrate-binding protein